MKVIRVPGVEATGFQPTDLYGVGPAEVRRLFKTHRVGLKDMVEWTLESGNPDSENTYFIPNAASFMPWFLNPLLPVLYPPADRETIRQFRNLSMLDGNLVEYQDILNYVDLISTPMAVADPYQSFAFLAGFCKHGAPPVCAGFADLMSGPMAKNMARSSHWARMHDPGHISFLRLMSDAMRTARDFFLPQIEVEHTAQYKAEHTSDHEGWLDNIHSRWPFGPRLGPENTPESYAGLIDRNPEVFAERAAAFFSRMAVYAPQDAVSLTALWDDLKTTVGVEHWQYWLDDAAKEGIEFSQDRAQIVGEWFTRSHVMRPAFAELVYAHATTVSGGDSLWRIDTETVQALVNTPWTPPEGGITFEMVDEGDFMLPFPGFYLELEPGALTLDSAVSGDRRPWASVDDYTVIDVEGVFICQARACTGIEHNGVHTDVKTLMADLQATVDAAGNNKGTITIAAAIEHGLQVTAVGRPRGLYQFGRDLFSVDEQWATVHLCGDILGPAQEGGCWDNWPEDSKKLARFAANFLLALNQEQLDTETVTRVPRVKDPNGGGGRRRRPKSPKEPFTKVRLGPKARQASRSSKGRSLGKLLKPVRVSKHRAFFWVLDPGERKPWATKVRDDGTTVYKIRRARKAHERGRGRVTSRNYDVSS